MLNSLISIPLRNNKGVSISTLHGCWNLFCHVLHFGTLLGFVVKKKGCTIIKFKAVKCEKCLSPWKLWTPLAIANKEHKHEEKITYRTKEETKLSFKEVNKLKTGINIKYTTEYVGYSRTNSLPVQWPLSGMPVITSIFVANTVYTRGLNKVLGENEWLSTSVSQQFCPEYRVKKNNRNSFDKPLATARARGPLAQSI